LSLKNGITMNKNRCSLDIVRDVLSIVSVKARKTRIMYGANLSFVQVEKYLAVLLGNSLLEYDGDSGYLITEKGSKFLQLYEDYQNRYSRLRQEFDRNMKDRLTLENMCFNNQSEDNQVGLEKIISSDAKTRVDVDKK
jgi:predicted transcriptional regulator